MQLVPSKMNLKLILAICALSFSSCENRERYSESYNKILVNDINTAKGYAKAFNLKPDEVRSYYLDFFRLYLLDKKQFKALKSFLCETGEGLTEKSVGLGQIYEAASFNASCGQSDEKKYFIVSLSIKNTLVARFLVDKTSAGCLMNNESYQKTFLDFVNALKSN
jgi:hypothetical protein